MDLSAPLDNFAIESISVLPDVVADNQIIRDSTGWRKTTSRKLPLDFEHNENGEIYRNYTSIWGFFDYLMDKVVHPRWFVKFY